jgi:hypothetical protein
MKRSLGYLISGLAGVVLGFLIGRETSPRVDEPAASVVTGNHAEARRSDSARSKSSSLSSTILLGEIATVPFQELYGLLAQRPPAEIAAIAAQLRALPEGRDKRDRITAFFKAWAHLDPAAAFKSAIEFQTIEARETALSATIGGADATADASLAEALNNLPADAISSTQKSGLLGLAIGKWAQVDAPAAAEFLDHSPATGMGFTLAFHEVAQQWAANDPTAAMNWAIQHSSGRGPSALSGAISGWWQKDPAAAEAYAAAHASGPEGQQFVSAVVSEIARQDPRKAAAWASGLPSSESRRQGYTMIAVQWAMNDPRAASEWAATLPNETMATALDSSIAMWAENDPQAAGQWIGTLGGAARDQAASVYSNSVVQRDPAAAMTWALTIGDPSLRERSMQQVASQWKERDAAAANTWIQNSSLGDAEKTRLLGSPSPRP